MDECRLRQNYTTNIRLITERIMVYRITEKLIFSKIATTSHQLGHKHKLKHQHSFYFFNLIQCIVVCRYVGIIDFVKPHNDRVSSFWILHISDDSEPSKNKGS